MSTHPSELNLADASLDPTTALNELFLGAISRGDAKLIQEFISSGANVNYISQEDEPMPGLTPLKVAVIAQKPEMVGLLLENKALLEPNSHFPSPLQIAARNGNLEIAKLLLENSENKADIHYKEGMSALEFAVREANIAMVKYLVQQGANPLEKNKQNQSLIVAALEACIDFSGNGQKLVPRTSEHYKNLEEIIKILVQWGVDINDWPDYRIADEQGNKPTHPLNGYTPLMIACAISNVSLVKCLVSMGADINLKSKKQNDHNLYPFRVAYYALNVTMMQLLISFGAVVEYHPPDLPRLEMMRSNAHPGTLGTAPTPHVRFLASYDAINDLFYFVNRGTLRRKMPLADLFNQGAHFNQRESHSTLDTPLHLACKHGHVNATKALLAVLSQGDRETQIAVLSAQNKDHATPLDIAATREDPAISYVLMDAIQGLIDSVMIKIKQFKAFEKLPSDVAQHIYVFCEKTPQHPFANQPLGSKLVEEIFAKSYAQSDFLLGLRYFNGKEVPSDLKRAAVHFYRAAKQGHNEALYNLAVFYLKGTGVTQSTRLAILCAQKLAKRGVVKAYMFLASLYKNGCNDQPPDPLKWLENTQAAANLGEPTAIIDCDLYHQNLQMQQNLQTQRNLNKNITDKELEKLGDKDIENIDGPLPLIFSVSSHNTVSEGIKNAYKNSKNGKTNDGNGKTSGQDKKSPST